MGFELQETIVVNSYDCHSRFGRSVKYYGSTNSLGELLKWFFANIV